VTASEKQRTNINGEVPRYFYTFADTYFQVFRAGDIKGMMSENVVKISLGNDGTL
jgi:hypothetical protein